MYKVLTKSPDPPSKGSGLRFRGRPLVVLLLVLKGE